MTRRSSSVLAGLGLALLVGGTLAGCATGTAVDPGGNGQEVPGAGSVEQIDVMGAWLDGGRMIGIVTEGSSSCVPTVGEVSLDGATLDVVLEDPAGDTPCTRDLVPRVSLVTLPEGLDPTLDLSVAVTGPGYEGTLDLPGVPGLDPSAAAPEEGTPSAGWTSENGEFIVLTYGSSSCLPIIENAAKTGGTEVTVTFAEPPADQVCTMDFAPRGTLAFADGLADQPNVTLKLTGGGETEAAVPILGANYVEIPLG